MRGLIETRSTRSARRTRSILPTYKNHTAQHTGRHHAIRSKGVIKILAPQSTNGTFDTCHTYGLVAADAGETQDTQDAATYWGKVGYTSDAWVVVVDARANQVPSVGTLKTKR